LDSGPDRTVICIRGAEDDWHLGAFADRDGGADSIATHELYVHEHYVGPMLMDYSDGALSTIGRCHDLVTQFLNEAG
jgi:hypothetical protein